MWIVLAVAALLLLVFAPTLLVLILALAFAVGVAWAVVHDFVVGLRHLRDERERRNRNRHW